MAEAKKGSMTVKDAGKLGGDKRAAELGVSGYVALGRLGGTATKQRHGAGHYAAIGKIGGAANRDRGCDYAELGRRGGAAPRRFMEAGKKVDRERDVREG